MDVLVFTLAEVWTSYWRKWRDTSVEGIGKRGAELSARDPVLACSSPSSIRDKPTCTPLPAVRALRCAVFVRLN